MATFEKKKLSGGGATNFPLFITNTIPGGTIIHQTGSSSTILDEIWLWGYNPNSTAQTITIYFFSTSPVIVTIEPYSQVLIFPGLLLAGDGTNGSAIYGEASVYEMIVYGYVNRITP